MDSIVQIWWLAWTAHAFPHPQNIFLGQGLNYPFGQNFGVNGSMVALGVIFLPITKLFGPVVAWNLALRFAVAVSAASMCLVLRRWTVWWPAAFLGGLLYGFSAYISWNVIGGDYLFLIFVPLPPLIFLLLHEILVRQQWRPATAGVVLGLVCALQFFISTEVLACTAVMGAVTVVLFVLVQRHILIERWRYAMTAFGYGLGVICLLLFYPVLFTFTGAQHISGPPFSPAKLALFPGDFLSPIVPYHDLLHLNQLAFVGQSFTDGGLLYLGIPIIVVLAIFFVVLRRRREIVFFGTMATIAFALSLGSRLHFDGHQSQIPLPFILIEHLPALNGILATRFSLFTALFASAMFAVGIDELRNRLRQPGRFARLSPGWGMAAGSAVLATVAGAVTIPLIPSSTRPSVQAHVPAFFTSAAVHSIPPGSVVLAYPYPDLTSTGSLSIFLPTPNVMLDQAVAEMRFRLIGGYGWFPSPTGRFGTTAPALLEPPSVEALFDVALTGTGTAAQRIEISKSDLTTDLRDFLGKYDVQTVIVIHLGNATDVINHVTAAIGPPVESGGVTVWFHVKDRLAAVSHRTSLSARGAARPDAS